MPLFFLHVTFGSVCAVFVYSKWYSNRILQHCQLGGGLAERWWFLFCDVTSPDPTPLAPPTSLPHEPSPASRRVSGPGRRVLECVSVEEKTYFRCSGSQKGAAWAAGSPRRELEASHWPASPSFAGLPGAEERRRVPAQHKGVPQGLHIIPRRGKRLFFFPSLLLLYTFQGLHSAAYTTPCQPLRHPEVHFCVLGTSEETPGQ